MSCRSLDQAITENIRIPVARFFEVSEETCHEVRRFVEREVTRRVESERSRIEEICSRQECTPFLLCLNLLVCRVVTNFYIVVEFIVEVVGEWLIETICETVTKLVKIIVEAAIAFFRLVVVFVNCLLTDPTSSLIALVDFWFDAIDSFEEVGDLIKDVIDDVVDLLWIVEEFLQKLASVPGPVGRLFIGLVAGLVGIMRRAVDGLGQLIEGVFDLASGLMRLDFCFAAEAFVKGLGFGLVRVVLSAVNLVGLGNRGSRNAFSREALRLFVRTELARSNLPADRINVIHERLRLASESWGIDWSVIPRISAISSRSPHFDLRQMHLDGVINLYAIGGYAPIGCSDPPLVRAVHHLVYRDTFLRVTLSDIRAYLNGVDTDAPEFQIVASDKDVFKDMLLVARRKFREMGVFLNVAPLETFELVAEEERMVDWQNGAHRNIANRLTSEIGLHAFCDLPAAVVFGYEPGISGINPGLLGIAALFWRRERPRTTAATVRTSFMTHVFGTVLAHEMGHCFSLCHAEHDGAEHIMFTAASGGRNCGVNDPSIMTGGDLDRVTVSTIAEYLFSGGEPVFSFADGQNTWLWIIHDAHDCLPR